MMDGIMRSVVLIEIITTQTFVYKLETKCMC